MLFQCLMPRKLYSAMKILVVVPRWLLRERVIQYSFGYVLAALKECLSQLLVRATIALHCWITYFFNKAKEGIQKLVILR